MDVHAPHKPIHSIKEFLVHLLAITIGLLIALGLEATVEWVHHRHLARDARENIYQEFRANQQDVLRQLKALPAEDKHLDEILSVINGAQHGRPQKSLENFMWTGVLLRNSAWNAASSTGAIAFMDYSEVRRYSQIYDLQKIYVSLMDRNLQERHQMNVFLAHMAASGKLSDAEYESGKQIILSQKMAIQEYHEVDSYLNDDYSKLLSRAK
jgi:hypothetical protein